jgi:hypothetical protein
VSPLAGATVRLPLRGAELQVLQAGLRCREEATPAIVHPAHGWRLFEECSALQRCVGYELQVVKDGSVDGDLLLIARDRSR